VNSSFIKKNNLIKSQIRSLHNKSDLDPWFITGLIDFSSIRQFSTKSSNTNDTNLNLVIWGTNLTSQVGTGRFTKQVSNMIKFPPYQYSVIIGLLLSDGWIVFSSKTSKNARLGFKQYRAHSKYLWFVFNILSHYCSDSPQLRSTIRAGSRHYSLEFFSRSLPCMTELRSLFYPNGVKIVPNNIYELLTPVALAHLIMGDGSIQRHGLIICTDSYTVKDIVRLMNVLIIRYRLECILRAHRQNQYRIYIKQCSMTSLLNIVSPFMHSSMLYKFKSALSNPSNRNKIKVFDLQEKTTTSYNSISEAARALKINKAIIALYFSRNQQKPYKGIYTFKKL